MNKITKTAISAMMLSSTGAVSTPAVDNSACSSIGKYALEAFNKKSSITLHDMFAKIAKKTGLASRSAKLVLVCSFDVNAVSYVDSDGTKKVGMYAGMLYYASENTIAFLLGHELAHHALGHTSTNISTTDAQSRRDEKAADKLGARFAMRAGYTYGACDTAYDLFRFESDIAESHPSNNDRHSYLTKWCSEINGVS